MSEEKWDGPWDVYYEDGEYIGLIVTRMDAKGGFCIVAEEVSENDAHLIAAAPDLYAALKSALLLVDMSTSYRRQDIAEMGKNALKKARGES